MFHHILETSKFYIMPGVHESPSIQKTEDDGLRVQRKLGCIKALSQMIQRNIQIKMAC